MSEAATNPPNAEAKPEPAKAAKAATAVSPGPGPALPILVGAAAGALIVGAVVGLFVIGPLLVKARRPAGAETTHKAEKGGEAQRGEARSAMFKLDNLIVNPAGTQGMRYIMATVAFEVPDEKTVEALKVSEIKIRDRVVGVIENESLADLMLPGARDTLRQRIGDAVAPEFKGVASRYAVYLPSFVIQ
jgi:flagellar protein FliL